MNSHYTVRTLTDRAALNYYYIVGLVVMAALLVIAVAAIAALLCYKTMGGGDHMTRSYHDRPDAGMQKGSMMRTGHPGPGPVPSQYVCLLVHSYCFYLFCSIHSQATIFL